MKHSLLIVTFIINFLFAAFNAHASTCNLKVEQIPEGVAINIPGSVQLKIEKKWVKTRIPAAFDTYEWDYANFSSNGSATITGKLTDSSGDKIISRLYAKRNGNKYDWYVVANNDAYTGNGNWTVAYSQNGEVTCTTVKNVEEFLKNEDIELSNHKVVHALSASYLYSQMGL